MTQISVTNFSARQVIGAWGFVWISLSQSLAQRLALPWQLWHWVLVLWHESCWTLLPGFLCTNAPSCMGAYPSQRLGESSCLAALVVAPEAAGCGRASSSHLHPAPPTALSAEHKAAAEPDVCGEGHFCVKVTPNGVWGRLLSTLFITIPLHQITQCKNLHNK